MSEQAAGGDSEGSLQSAAPGVRAWHALSAANACSLLATDPAAGLAGEIARQRLERHGPNELPESARTPLWKVFASRFASPPIYILLVAAMIAFGMGHTEPLSRIFHTVPIPLTECFLIGVVASSVLWAEEIRKFFARRLAIRQSPVLQQA